MKLTLGQIITLASAFGGVIPLAVNFFNSAKEAYATCMQAVTPVWAVGLLLVSAISGALSKSFVETVKEAKK
jgi:hypothetical protein